MHENNGVLAARVREIRLDKCGADGITTLSHALSIPPRTWENYENGVTIPAWILLQFIALTDVEPSWLLTGQGNCYRDRSVESSRGASH
jgi:hypothetical protein